MNTSSFTPALRAFHKSIVKIAEKSLMVLRADSGHSTIKIGQHSTAPVEWGADVEKLLFRIASEEFTLEDAYDFAVAVQRNLGSTETTQTWQALATAVSHVLKSLRRGNRGVQLAEHSDGANTIYDILAYGGLSFPIDAPERSAVFWTALKFTDRDGYGFRNLLAASLLAASDWVGLEALYRFCRKDEGMLTPAVHFASACGLLMADDQIEGTLRFIDAAKDNPFAADYLINSSGREVRLDGHIGGSWQEVAEIAFAWSKHLEAPAKRKLLKATDGVVELIATKQISEVARGQKQNVNATPSSTLEYYSRMVAPKCLFASRPLLSLAFVKDKIDAVHATA